MQKYITSVEKVSYKGSLKIKNIKKLEIITIIQAGKYREAQHKVFLI